MDTSSDSVVLQPNNPLLTTKLYIPQPRRNLALRPRLTLRLNQALDCALTIISAPPGFGKTTLLSEWSFSKAEGGRPILSDVEGMKAEKDNLHPAALIPHPFRVAWLSLDEDDNDPARFLSYLIAALQTVQPTLGETTLTTLRVQSQSLAPVQNDDTACVKLMIPLINELAAFLADADTDLVLILDDYHVIDTPAIHRALTHLLDHIPPRMHVVLASRTEPPLPLPRLRVRRQLLELEMADLRFTPTEATQFLNNVMGLDLSPEEVATLETRTEGWIAGLQMAALSMQDCADIPHFIASFKGSHRFVFDYLAVEVLQQQSDTIQTFLLKTAILNRLTPLLGDALVGFNESQTILEYLEQANLFLVPLDNERRWFRYHHLFADFLRDRLQRHLGAQAVADLHRRAAEWFEQNDLTAEAVSHALAAADVERAVRLVEQSGSSMLLQSELTTLLKWLQALPEETVRTRSRLSLFHGWALVFTGQLEAVDGWLQTIETTTKGAEIPGELTALRATVAFFQRDLARAVQWYRQAFAELPEENLFLRGAVALSLATAYNLQGNLAGAGRAFAQAATISQANGNGYMAVLATCNLAQLHVAQAQLHRAAELYRQALQLADRQAVQDGAYLPNTGRALVGLGEILYQWNNLDEATQYLQQGLAWGQQRGDAIALMRGYLALAQVKQAQGDVTAAFAAVSNAEKFAQTNSLPSWGIRLAASRVHLWLAQGNVEAAAPWLDKDWLSLSTGNADDSAGYADELRQIEQLTRAQLFMAQNKPEAALAILSPLFKTVTDAGRTGLVLEILVLQAMAHYIHNNTAGSITALEKAIRLAEPEGYCRLFIDAGVPMVGLLNQPAVGKIAPAFVRGLLAAFPPPGTSGGDIALQIIDPLSDRELELLQLIAAGMSNQQVAAELVLTVGTVKWHLSNIYSKLGVSRRTQAVAQARELRLL